MKREEVDKIIDQYADMVFRIALIHCANYYEDAEDVFQEVFLALVRKFGRFRNEEHCKAWLIRVTLNQCKKKYYFRRRIILMEESSLNEKVEADQEKTLDDSCNILYQSLCELPQKYREVVELYYFEDFSSKEIAYMLKLSDTAVRKRLSRGREILRANMRGGGDNAE